MNTVKTPLIIGLSALLLAAAGCSDDVVGGDSNCGANEIESPITGECQACADGEQANPIQNICEPVDANNDGTNANNDSNNSTNNDSNNESTNGGVWNSSTNNDGNNDSNNDSNNGSNNGTPGGDTDYDPYQPQDPDTAQYHSCDSDEFEGLPEPLFLMNGPENYLLALPPTGLDIDNIQGAAADPKGQVFVDGDDDWTGFILSINPPAGESSASGVADWVYNQLGAAGLSASIAEAGTTTTTLNGFGASVLNHVSLNSGDDSPSAVRDQIVGQLSGLSGADIDFDLDEVANGDGSGIHMSYKTVFRGPDQAIVVGALTTSDLYDSPDSPARFALQDLAGGTAMSVVGDTMSDQCVSREVENTDEIDIIVAMDASGSMDAVQSGLVNFADELVNILDGAGVDWRVGVTGSDCDEIREDDALSPEFRALWPDPDEWEEDDIPIPFPNASDIIPENLNTPCRNPDGIGGIGGGDNNGRLMGGSFTTDAGEIADRIGQVSSTGIEYTLTMGLAAIDHSLPRADVADKIRPNAAVVVIVVTDENEQLFKDAFSWISSANAPLSSSNQNELEEFIDPWLEFVNRPDVNATVSGLYWVPGETCPGVTDDAGQGHGIHYIVEQTGGSFDSICSPNTSAAFGDIAEATQELSTGLFLLGKPYSGSVQVDRIDLNTGDAQPLVRSIEDGFDFDTTNNSVFFEGPSAPADNQRVVVPYLQWDGAVVTCNDAYPCPNDGDCIKGVCQ